VVNQSRQEVAADQMPHDSANPDYGAKVLAKARFCPDFSVEAVKLRVSTVGNERIVFTEPSQLNNPCAAAGTKFPPLSAFFALRLNQGGSGP
jgi:hypothetical protein